MAEDIGALAVKIAMDDSTFQQGMQNLKLSMSVIESGFKDSISVIKNWGSSLDGLKANAQAFGDKIEVQRQILQKYSDQLQKSNYAHRFDND